MSVEQFCFLEEEGKSFAAWKVSGETKSQESCSPSLGLWNSQMQEDFCTGGAEDTLNSEQLEN